MNKNQDTPGAKDTTLPQIHAVPPVMTPAGIEDWVRAKPENQGLNEDRMWGLIDKEVEKYRNSGKLNENVGYAETKTGNVHGSA